MSDLHLQSRDLELFQKLVSYRLTTDMIAQILGAPEAPLFRKSYFIDRRLTQLTEGRYIKRETVFYEGRTQSLYALTAKGYALTGLPPLRPRSLSERKSPHDLRVFEVMIAVEQSVKRHPPRFELLHFYPDGAFTIPLKREDGGETVMKPDGTIVLAFQEQPFLFFLEVDRSTEPVSPTRAYEVSNFRRKIEGYAAFKQANFENLPGIQELQALYGSFKGRFRVLTVTSSHQRANNLRDLAGRLGKVNKFLFMDFATLQKSDALSSPCWQAPAAAQQVLFTLPPVALE